MRRKPSRPSKKRSRRSRRVYAKGPRLALVLVQHPEVQRMLEKFKLSIDVNTGRLVARAYWPCPQPPYGIGCLKPGYKPTQR